MNHDSEAIQPNSQPDEATALAWLIDYAREQGIAPAGLYLDAIRVGGTLQVVLMDKGAGTILRLRAEKDPGLHEAIGRLICDGKGCAMTLGATGVRYDHGFSQAVGAP